MPYKKAGFSDREAAAYLIDRFTFGPKPGSVDELLQKGPENWFLEQLQGKLPDDSLNLRLSVYDAIQLSNQDVLYQFPEGGDIAKEAALEGIKAPENEDDGLERKNYRKALKDFMDRKGYRPQQELLRQTAGQKIWRAAYSNNQLHQVLTEFWFNHFNVSASKNQSAPFIPAYERDVIRPRVAGRFYDLLKATAQSPAMLFYLDNFSSAGENELMNQRRERIEQRMNQANAEPPKVNSEKQILQRPANGKPAKGLNENYAREIMELHTLGVDGGYTQQDVTEAARILTGWTIYPFEKGPGAGMRKMVERMGEDRMTAAGFVHQGDFLFAANRHDTKEKSVMGVRYPANGGYEEGEQLLKFLAAHNSTAQFICKKLAIRFVCDEPPVSLIQKMADTYRSSDGSISEVLKTMVAAPEFWNKQWIGQKTKSPFELVISAVRAVDADVMMPFMLYQWMQKMGQQLYFYQAPTGFPDRGTYWINTGSLLNRMNFGLAFASQKIPGVKFSLIDLNQQHEPESAYEALKIYSQILLPGRNTGTTIKRLTPIINDPALAQKVTEAAAQAKPAGVRAVPEGSRDDFFADRGTPSNLEERLAQQLLRRRNNGKEVPMAWQPGESNMLTQVVGILIGSPEFQRR